MHAAKQSSTSTAIRIRPLISYALSSYSMARGNDYFDALVPLCVPISEDNAGRLFEPKNFCAELHSKYDLSINEHVAENFILPMHKAGLLEKTIDSTRKKAYRYCSSPSTSLEKKYIKFEKKISDIFKQYHLFISSLNSLTTVPFSSEDLENGLIDWILKSNESLDISSEYKNKPKSELDFVASRFLTFLKEEHSDLFDDLALIHSGAVVSELVLDYKIPETSKKTAQELSIYLDAPFVMHLLQLSGIQQYENANEVFKQLKRLKVKLYMFEHSCEEIEGNIDGVLSPTNNDRYGPLATAINNREVMQDYAKSVRNNLKDRIEELGIKIFDPSVYGSGQDKERFFSKGAEDRLNEVINWTNPIAARRDVRSISTVIRWRGRTKERDYLKSKHLFVTTNRFLASKVRSFCIEEELLNISQAPPVITLEKLSGLLFLMLGDQSEKISMSRKQLLYNCGRAAIANPEMIRSFSEKLKELSPKNADQVSVILSEPKTVQLVMDLTMGNADLITSDNVEEVFESLKEEITKEQTKKHRKKIKTLKEERDLMANDNERHKEKWRDIVSTVIEKEVSYVKKVKFYGVIILVTLSVFALILPFLNIPDTYKILSNTVLLSSGAAGIMLSFYPFFFSPLWLQKQFTSWKIRRVTRRLEQLGMKDKLTEYIIDWKTAEVKEKYEDLLS